MVVAARYVDERTLVCTTPDVSHLCVEGPAAVQVSMLRPPRGERVYTDDAREFIATEYAQLRAKASETNKTLPVTARQLETMIRLATAHAKVHAKTK